MLASYYMGRPAALEILGDKLTAIYEDGRIALRSTRLPRASVVTSALARYFEDCLNQSTV